MRDLIFIDCGPEAAEQAEPQPTFSQETLQAPALSAVVSDAPKPSLEQPIS